MADPTSIQLPMEGYSYSVGKGAATEVLQLDRSLCEFLKVEPLSRKSGGDRVTRNVKVFLPPLPFEHHLFTATPLTGSRESRSLTFQARELLATLGTMQIGTAVDLISMTKELNIDLSKACSVCNVLEAVQMTDKVKRNVYMWKGRSLLASSLDMLAQLAIRQDVQTQVSRVERGVERTEREDKITVGVVTQKLLMIFLVCPLYKPVTLEMASEVIFGPKGTKQMAKLTMISSVLVAAGLLDKVDTGVYFGKPLAYLMTGSEIRQRKVEVELMEKRDLTVSDVEEVEAAVKSLF